jgi:hypothetical protein
MFSGSPSMLHLARISVSTSRPLKLTSLWPIPSSKAWWTWTRLLLSPDLLKWDLGGVPERDGRVAQKLKKKFEEVPLSKSIRGLVGDQHFRAGSDGVGEAFYFIYNVAIMFHGMNI